MFALFASTALGLEELLKNELEALGAHACRIVPGGVHFEGDQTVLYTSLLWSRLASRVLLPITECEVWSDRDLYLGAQMVNWPEWFADDATFVVQFHGTSEEIRHSQYGALKVKDAIVDSFTRRQLPRPSVDREAPDIVIHVRLHRRTAHIALDLSGTSLHLRGYRLRQGKAALKETLAAAIVLRSGWHPGTPFVDPMCGAGTLAIEAAMLAADCAPGLHRTRWGFQRWKQHDAACWAAVSAEAQTRFRRGLAAAQPCLLAQDRDGQVLQAARENARRAGVASLITFREQDIRDLRNPFPPEQRGTVLCNPPWGERLESEPALIALYNQLGRIVRQQFPGWRLSVYSTSPALLDCLPLRSERQFLLKNGPLDGIQKNYPLLAQPADGAASGAAEDYANRLRKNCRRLDKWARREGVTCYRLYDADLPNYNVAVDRYEDKVVVQEYAPPKTVDSRKARQRLFDVIQATLEVLDLAPGDLILKTRERQKGKSQYQKLADRADFMTVREYDARLLVNLTDYLDTGLFIDHRLARRQIQAMSRDKDFLNLFAYTGTATVYAGLGGARSTTSVDLSRTYLEWAERNLRLNGLTGRAHRLIQADCLSWLASTTEQFDLIFVDPPTFSNSKRMSEDFDVQRDHLHLLTALKAHLRPGGTILFSNNKRKFQLDEAGLAAHGLSARNITQQTLSPDFSRNPRIHHCWLITHSETEQNRWR